MGVNGLWQVVQPCARPTNLATLNRKRLAVDASIWIYQFLKAVRDKEGNSLRNSHVVGFFRRICKLLWYGILPVFVFDGGAPALKRQTILARKRRREGRREDAVKTAGKLLAVQMHRRAEEEEAIRKKKEAAGPMPVDENEEPLPDMNNVVYVEELGMSKQERMRNRKFHKQDPYHLPTIDTSLASMARPEDPRIMSIEELEEYARNFNSGEDINLYDFSKIDFGGDFFKSLPSVDRYNILNAARLRSRLRMGLSKEQLEDMFPDRMAFSRFQIERVRERNNLTQRLMQEAGMTGLDLTINGSGRIAGDKDREYILVKNEGAEGGWALGVVSKDRDLGESHKPIDVDALQFEYQKKSEPEEDDEDDFEDVPIPGLNRLPPINQNTGPVSAAADLEARERYVRQRLHDFTTNDGNAEPLDEDPDSLFVGQDIDDPQFPIGGESGLYTEEEDDINKAIALSLQSQHGIGNQPESSLGEGEPEEPEIAAPVWKQRAAETPTNPIMTKSGRMVAHIVNNRANAAVARQRVVNTRPGNEGDSDSDSSVDLQRTLAKSNKSRKEKPGKSDPNASNPFALQTPKPPQHNLESADGDAAMDELPGGFEREPHDDKAPKPLPPWLVHDGDIRDSLKHQKTLQEEMNAEDRDMAIEKQQEWERQQRDEILEISSSDEESNDVELVEDPTSLLEDIPIDPALTMSGAISSEATLEVAAHASPDSPEPEFENVGILNEAAAASVPPTLTVEITSDLEKRAPQGSLHPTEEMMLPTRMSAKPSPEAKSAEPSTKNDDFLFNDDDDASVEDDEEEFSDPEEAELLVQMEAEAQEHARFASELNSKSTQENLRDYEMELRQLRTQQKKDRRDADEVNSTMVAECQALLGLFGIPYITAPMEAEAQCAELVSLGLVDGIVTDDSDIFLFGGTRVYKNMFSTNKFVECYLSSDLEREMSLSREQLVSLAQLLGSDYTEGLAGVGPVTAVEIISEFSGPTGLDDFRTWWDDVQCNNRPREADADKPFRRKFRKSQATKLFLPPGFPSPAVTEAYLEPEVDHSNEAFQWGVPDVEGLRQFLMNTIGWGKARTDEVLLPVVKDINRREIEGTQANITRFFEGSVGTGRLEAFAPRQRTTTSKRMTDAVSKLRQRTLVDSMGVQTEASGQGPSTSVPAVTSRAKQPRKRQRRDTAIEESDEDGPAEHEDSADVNKRSGAGRGKKARA
ncbi:unnamed protein product [Parascedosporium putredinis]|uniref:PIN domain-like protein n=1 Tax=Parascedosporium putredinis TaxID=1442378 RepID=A0A9P1MCP6_9PEZI|nr:unnamed protein product [Parascedosporium putredinis]CAI8002042.1 unnamed protein product [Parascedosporium putredinis]